MFFFRYKKRGKPQSGIIFYMKQALSLTFQDYSFIKVFPYMV